MLSCQDNPKILLVDDDKVDRQFARHVLENQDYFVFEAMNGQRLREILNDHPIDLILLDLMLPGENGLNLISAIRDRTNAPIIIISGINGLKEKQEGLDKGADDYLTKPFYPEELQARIKANLRRYHRSTDGSVKTEKPTLDVWTVDKERFDAVSHTGTCAGLTIHEYRLLEKLVLARGRVLTRADLCEQPNKRGIDVQIARLRKKLGDSGRLIQTVRGAGYRCIFSKTVFE